MADEDYMVSSRWPSGLVWHYTAYYPNFFGLNAEIVYLYLITIYIKSWTYVKLLVLFTIILIVARVMGVSLRGLIRKCNQWRIGPYRSLYSHKANKLRFFNGF